MFSINELQKLNEALKTCEGYSEGLVLEGIPKGKGPYRGCQLVNERGEKVHNPGLVSLANEKAKNT